MNKRPLSITIIGVVFLATGVIGLSALAVGHLTPRGVQHDLIWVSLLRLLAIICGVFLLRGHNWARWLALIWLAIHVASAFPAPFELLLHGLLMAVVTWLLFRRPASTYFRDRRPVLLSNDSTQMRTIK